MNFVGFWVCLGTRGMVVMAFFMWGERERERERERDLLRLKRAIHNPHFLREISD